MRIQTWALTALLMIAIPTQAMAEPTEAAKTTAREFTASAAKALDEKDYARALEFFERAYALVPAPTLALGRARSLVGLGKLRKALEIYQTIVKDGAPKGASAPILRAIESAKTESAELQNKLGTLTIVLPDGASGAVTLDGESYPKSLWGSKQPIDPGDHEVVASLEGKEKLTRKIKVAQGESATVNFAEPVSLVTPLAPRSDPSPGQGKSTDPSPQNPGATPGETAPHKGSVQRTVGWVTLGVGGAALIAGGVVGGLGLSKRSDLDGKCPNGSCPPKYWNDVDSVGTYRTVSSIALYSGIALAATGAVLVLTSPSKSRETTGWAAPYVGAGQAGFTGAFLRSNEGECEPRHQTTSVSVVRGSTDPIPSCPWVLFPAQ